MKVFLDANILVSVLNKEYPLFTFSSRLLSLADSKKFSLFASPVGLAIAFYFSEKKSGSELARKKIEVLTDKLRITTVDESVVRKSLGDRKVKDIEAGLQFYSALKSGCQCIVTEDREDFYFATVEVLSTEEFLKQHAWS